ncbi:MAG: Gldg family protein [Deltaproteobacteria bacterium]|nr:Gldg family protein [Deltaproteobacteria bacterium]
MNLAIVIGATLAIAILLNVLVMGTRARVDLSENQVNVLSDASREAVAALDGLEVRLYVSPDLPESVPMGYGADVKTQGLSQKLRDKLEEYRAYGSGMTITAVTEDVVADAERNGLKPFTGKGANLSATGTLEFDKYVLGASFHYENASEVFDLALDPKYYEFEITKRLLRLKDKADSAVLIKDLLAAGAALGDAAKTCTTALEAAVPDDKGSQDLAAMLSGEATQSKLTALAGAVGDLDKACGGVAPAVDKAKAFDGKNDPLDRMVLIANALVERLAQMKTTLAAEDPQAKAQALGQHAQLVAIGQAIAKERGDLDDSPGRRRIGFVCNAKTFCPFASDQPLVPKELEGALLQKNPILQQMLPAVQRIQDEMNMVLTQINQQLFKARGFDIVKVDLDEDLPDDMQALLVLGPKGDFTDWQLSQIDQFVMNGGSLVVFLDPWDVSIQLYSSRGEIEKPSMRKNTSNIATLLTSYGIVPKGGMVLEPKAHDELALMQFIRQGQQLIPFQSRGVPYPMLPTFTSFDTADPLVRATTSLTLPFTTYFDLADKPGVTLTALVRSSPEAAAMDRLDFPLDPDTQKKVFDNVMVSIGAGAPELFDGWVDEGKELTVVALAKGELPSHFAGKPAPVKPEKAPDPEDPEAAKKDDVPGTDKPRKDKGTGRVLALGSNLGLEPLSREAIFEGFDLSMIAGENMDYIEKFQQYRANYQNWSTRIGQVQHTLGENLQFLQNVLDWSVQREALAELRSKQIAARPLTVKEPGDETRTQVLGLLVPSALFLAAGLGWTMRQRARRKSLSL